MILVSNHPLAHDTPFSNTKLLKWFWCLLDLLTSHDTPIQNIKIIEIFWCQPGRTRLMTLIFKNVKRQL